MKCSKFTRLLRDERGSLSLEASFVFPLFLLVIMVLIIGGLYIQRYVTLQYISLTATERTAFVWNDRERDFATGMLLSDYYYGLYESDLMLQMISGFIGIGDSSNNSFEQFHSTTSSFPPSIDGSNNRSDNGGLMEDKFSDMKVYLQGVPYNLTGTLHYEQNGLFPQISVSIIQGIDPLYWEGRKLIDAPKFTQYTTLTNATDFIRAVDLVRYYTNKLKSMTSSEKQNWKSSSGKALKNYTS